uniref:Heterokaryon incompatibility domain-containing protein n=1 Tax=Chrysotila carterae TaxID=13221 RepID=A0A6S9ZQH7_CHRCT
MVSFDIARNELRGAVPWTLLARGTELTRLALLSPTVSSKLRCSLSSSTSSAARSSSSESVSSMSGDRSPEASRLLNTQPSRGSALERSQLDSKGAVLMDCCIFPVYAMRKHDVLRLERMPNFERALKQGILWMRQATLSPFGLAVMNPAGSALLGDVVLAARSCRAFYSHRWYCPETKEPHPDNADNAKLKQLQMLLRGPQSDVEFIWLDYWSVPQQDATTQSHVISALPYIVRTHGQFTAMVPNEAGLREYNGRGWCQLEQLASRCPFMGKQLETHRAVSLFQTSALTETNTKQRYLQHLHRTADEAGELAAVSVQAGTQMDEANAIKAGLRHGNGCCVSSSDETAPCGVLLLRELPDTIFNPCTDGKFGDDDMAHVPPEKKDRHRLKDVCDKVLAAIALETIDGKLHV